MDVDAGPRGGLARTAFDYARQCARTDKAMHKERTSQNRKAKGRDVVVVVVVVAAAGEQEVCRKQDALAYDAHLAFPTYPR